MMIAFKNGLMGCVPRNAGLHPSYGPFATDPVWILLCRSSTMEIFVEDLTGFEDAEGNMNKLTHHGA
jgi:hypothetical protein